MKPSVGSTRSALTYGAGPSDSEWCLLVAAGDGGDFETHAPGILHTQMAKASDAQHGDKIAGLCRRIAQGAEGRKSRAKQRRCVDGRKVVRNRHQAARPRDQHFGVPAVAIDAGEFLIAAVYEFASAAIFAVAAEAPEEADTGTGEEARRASLD
jgi:hypothetical protein